MKRVYSFKVYLNIVFATLLLFGFVLTNVSCGRKKTVVTGSELSGNLIIFHAGSLAMPFKAITDSFMIMYPKVKILAESSGSIDAARKITELKRDCDIIASSDYSVIDKFIIPAYADSNIHFAVNEMVIAYTYKSAYASEIDTINWGDILLRKDVIIGRSDPDADPCGYRTILTLKLAQKDFAEKGLKFVNFADRIIAKDNRFIRPKEVDLLALLDTRTVDYIFIYRSVAQQHHLKYLPLPAGINLGNPALNDHYATVQLEVRGSRPDEKITIKGEAMVYSAAIIRKAPNKAAAEAFMEFLLSESGGRKILKEMGQDPVAR